MVTLQFPRKNIDLSSRWRDHSKNTQWCVRPMIYNELIPLYLITKTMWEAENFSVGIAFHGMQDKKMKIERSSFRIFRIFAESLENRLCSVRDSKIVRLPVERAVKILSVFKF